VVAAEPPVLFCTDTAWHRYGPEFTAAAPGLEVVTLTGDDTVAESDLARIGVAFFSGDAWPGRTVPFISACLHAPNLQWLHTFSAGTDSPVFAEFVRRGARLTTSSGSSARPIAQTVVMMILGLSRDMPAWTRAQQSHEWAPHTGEEVDGSNVAIVGMGPIGEETARLTMALGMNTIGCRRTITGNEPCETRELAALPELLAWADYVVLALPLTPETEGLIGPTQLATMRPTARLINVGRGGLVDEPALVEALQQSRLAGAGLDVFAVEPLPPDSPLWDMPNVIITPHNSGATLLANHRGTQIFIDNLGRFVRREPLRNDVTATLRADSPGG
jgi:D-2-hydroxyacid dehydrogenase (NADP+)